MTGIRLVPSPTPERSKYSELLGWKPLSLVNGTISYSVFVCVRMSRYAGHSMFPILTLTCSLRKAITV